MSATIRYTFFTLLVAITLMVCGCAIYYIHQIPAPLERSPFTIQRPAQVPVIIDAGLYIDEFQRFDVREQQIVCTGIVWFVYDPKKVTREHLTKLKFHRCAVEQGTPHVVALPDSRERLEIPIKLHTSPTFNFLLYPFDDHTIDFVLINEVIDHTRIQFVASAHDFVIEEPKQKEGWRYYDAWVQPGIIDIRHPATPTDIASTTCAIQFTLACRRTNQFYALFILAPLIFFVFLSVMGFTYRTVQDVPTQIFIANTGIVSFFTWRFALGATVPSVEYFCVFDYLFFLFVLLAGLGYITALTTEKWPSSWRKVLISGLLLVLITAIVIIGGFKYMMAH